MATHSDILSNTLQVSECCLSIARRELGFGDELAWSVWSERVCTQLLAWKSQSLTLESLDPVAKLLPVGWKSTLRTQEV